MHQIERYRRNIDSLLASKRAYEKSIQQEQDFLIKAKQKVIDCQEAQKFLQEVSQKVQESAHKQIASVVSRCLESIFDEPYTFKINFHQKRGKTEAELVFIRDGNEIDPMSSSGGGVIDVASFALRLACLVLSQPRKRRLLALDEPFKMLSAEYSDRIASLIEILSKELDLQILIVTHNRKLAIGKVIEL